MRWEGDLMGSGRIVLLGYGMQGKAALHDLRRTSGAREILVADGFPGFEEEIRSLDDPRVRSVPLDAGDPTALAALMEGADVAVELLPGTFALPVARAAVRAGTNLVSAMYLADPGEPDPARREATLRELEAIDAAAREEGLTILEEFGMDPGIDLALGRQALSELDDVRVFHSYGAGFPEPAAADNPLRYKFTWSPIGVMRSYLRPATVIREGMRVSVPADGMFDPSCTHILDLPEIGGALECFPNGDGEHFADTLGIRKSVRSMGRYVCRWPGHGAFWGIMAKCGFLSDELLRVGESEVSPAAFCAALLGSREQFRYGPTERDIALVRIDARGVRDGRPTRVIYQVVDRRDLSTGFTAMQRTVGFPVSIGAGMILDGRIPPGIVSPDRVPFEPYVEELARRGILVTRKEEPWDGNEEP
jgi:saccharopine dehydrogenase-like NADP-dependent oxidoreductase